MGTRGQRDCQAGSRMTPGQLVQDHWKLIQRLANDDDEAQRVALYALEKFEQFKPERGAFATFIKMKLRELRQHYSDKGIVYHPCRKDAGGYVSLDETQVEPDSGDDEEVDGGLYNLIATLPPPDVPSWLQEVYYEETKSRRPAHCEKLGDLGRCPEPVKLRRRRERISPAAFRSELVAESAYASRIEARIYFAERAAGTRPLPKDTLWQKRGSPEGVETLSPSMFGRRWDGWAFAAKAEKSKWMRRSGRGPWRGDLTQWHEWRRYSCAYIRTYLERNGLGLRVRPSNSKKHSPFLSWVRRKETDELSPTKAIKKENADLLWAALRVLCYKRRWPNGIPSAKLFPEDRFSPRERLLHQARQVVAAANCKRTCWRRPLVRILKYPKNGPNFTTMAA